MMKTTEPQAGHSLDLTPEEASLVVDALSIAIGELTKRAGERRKLSEHGMTISTRRRANAEALDITAAARRVDAIQKRVLAEIG